MLSSTGPAEIAEWQAALQHFDRERRWYNQQYNANYDPPIWRWVKNNTWRILSADVLLSEDATDPTKGESPNDSAVIDLLLQRGKYAKTGSVKIGARSYEWAFEKFKHLQWPSHGKMTHTERLDQFLTAWFDFAATIHAAHMPTDKSLCRLMLKAIRPDELRERVESRMNSGLQPQPWPFSIEKEPWRQQARKQLSLMRRLIREHTNHFDKVNILAQINKTSGEGISNDASTWTRTSTAADPTQTQSNPTSHKQKGKHGREGMARQLSTEAAVSHKCDVRHSGDAPTCCLEECDRRCHRYAHGQYATTCTRQHHKLHRDRQRRTRQRVQVVPDC
jgi:hypothetical protein